MARKNRVSVYDGVYHVTTRIANRAMLLKPDEVKERLMKWIVSVANFSGVEVWGFTVMDNHLHLIVHVPPVPKEYWLDANEEPAAYAFGMRPPECRVPLWNGDSPSLGSAFSCFAFSCFSGAGRAVRRTDSTVPICVGLPLPTRTISFSSPKRTNGVTSRSVRSPKRW